LINPARLLFQLFGAMALIAVDLAEQGYFSVEDQVGNGDDVRRFGIGPADVQSQTIPPSSPV